MTEAMQKRAQAEAEEYSPVDPGKYYAHIAGFESGYRASNEEMQALQDKDAEEIDEKITQALINQQDKHQRQMNAEREARKHDLARIQELRAALEKQVEVSSSDRSALASVKWTPSPLATEAQLRAGVLAINAIVDAAIAAQPRWNWASEALAKDGGA